MHDKRDDYEPIIATRRSREPREDAQPLWRLVLALSVGLAVAVLLAWWLMDRSSDDASPPSAHSGSSAPESSAPESSAPESSAPEIRVEQAPAPPARDSEADDAIAQAPAPPARAAEPAADAEQTATPEDIPEAAPDDSDDTPTPLAPVSVRFVSPDPQVRFELRSTLDSSPALTTKVGDVVALPPGAYRVAASGAQLETFEHEITFDAGPSLEYTVELCGERQQEFGDLAGQVIEERACASTAQCESMFMVLSEQAEQLIKDRAFRAQQCAKWRPNAAPDGQWSLDIQCGGATLATTCRIEIAQGACAVDEPRRSLRGTACPRVQLK